MVEYEVSINDDNKKVITLSTEKAPYPSLADLLQVVAKEFKGVRKKDLLFSSDTFAILLGNDDLPEEE